MDEAELRAWIESVAGSTVTAVEPVGYGSSNVTSFVTLDDGRQWVARTDTGDGPVAGTELTLGRQAEMLSALDSSRARTARCVAVDGAGTTLLMERAAGTHTLPRSGTPERAAVIEDYIEALAELHQVEVDGLAIPTFAMPSTPEAHARNELDTWRRIYEARRQRRHPLVDFTIALLDLRAPSSVARTVICHGDVGPGNFVHQNGRVTALVDWEFTHVGDPMDDLAWWVFRGHDIAGDLGDLRAQLDHWSAATGLDVDIDAIEYYRAFVMLRWLICAIATVETGGPSMDRSVHNALIPLIGALLPQSLARVIGVELDPTAAVAETNHPLGTEYVLHTMKRDLTEIVAPATEDPAVLARLGGVRAYLGHLEMVDRIGASTAATNAADLGTLLDTDDAEPHAAFADRAAEFATARPEEAVRVLACVGDRAARLWPNIAPRAAAGLCPLHELGPNRSTTS